MKTVCGMVATLALSATFSAGAAEIDLGTYEWFPSLWDVSRPGAGTTSTATALTDTIPSSPGRGLGQASLVPFTDYGAPGNTQQLFGYGKSVEETNIQILSIPMNSPLGGGFDFATFPEYFFSDIRLSNNASFSGYDARGVVGSVELTPWTVGRYQNQRRPLKAGYPSSGVLLTQGFYHLRSMTSVGVETKDTAVQLGAVYGANQNGFTGALSRNLYRDEKIQINSHIFGTDMRSASNGSFLYATPSAYLESPRGIALVELNGRVGKAQTANNLYFDHGATNFADPGVFDTKSNFTQFGAESAWELAGNRAIFSARRILGESMQRRWPGETLLQLNLAKTIPLTSRLLLEPSLLGVVSTLSPDRIGAGLGSTFEVDPNFRFGGRFSWLPKYASLVDRFGNYPLFGGQFEGNPNISPERISQLTAFAEGRFPNIDLKMKVEPQFIFYSGVYQNIESPSRPGVFRPQSVGTGNLSRIKFSQDWSPSEDCVLSQGITFQHSYLSRTGQGFAMVPRVQTNVGAEARLSDRFYGDALAYYQSDSAGAVLGSTNRGYFSATVGISYRSPDFFRWRLGVENILNHRYESVEGYPHPGRIFSFRVQAEI